MTPKEVWEQALVDLALQMEREAFAFYLQGSEVMYITPKGVLHVRCRYYYVARWNEHRLIIPITRTLASISDKVTGVVFHPLKED